MTRSNGTSQAPIPSTLPDGTCPGCGNEEQSCSCPLNWPTALETLAAKEAWRLGVIHANYARNGGLVVDNEDEGLAYFTRSFSDVDLEAKLPAALQRSDNETLLYAGRLNTVFGLPGSGKSWIALILAHQTILQGGRVVYWDFEDSPSTIKRRGALIGFDPERHKEEFLYVVPAMRESDKAMAEAQAWLLDAPDKDKSLVVIDSASLAGCPADGSSVVDWFTEYVNPWRDVGVGVLLLDHTPKRIGDEPTRGGIGSQHKLAAIDGVALLAKGVPWTKNQGGEIHLINHKDRGGDIPAPVGKQVAIIKGTWTGDGLRRSFKYSVEPPTGGADIGELSGELLDALTAAGEVKGTGGYRDLVDGRSTDKDAAMRALVGGGLVEKDETKKPFAYRPKTTQDHTRPDLRVCTKTTRPTPIGGLVD